MGGVFQANPDKPISYGSGDLPYVSPYDIKFRPCLGWTSQRTPLDDHRLLLRLPQFQSWTRAEHAREALYAMGTARMYATLYHQMVARALEAYGDHGSLVSGVVRDHFPIEVQASLRELISRVNREHDRSLVHWRAARRTLITWRRLLHASGR